MSEPVHIGEAVDQVIEKTLILRDHARSVDEAATTLYDDVLKAEVHRLQTDLALRLARLFNDAQDSEE